MIENIKGILESLLFISEEPLTLERLKNILAPTATADIRSALEDLVEEHENRRGGFVLKEVAGGFQFRTRPEHSEWITKLIQPRPTRLSKAALETLAIIAYKQPLIRSDIEHIRGVDCGGVIRSLLERNLIRVLGRKEIPGRPLIYATTKRFLEVFDLRDLKDLPTPKEIDEMGQTLAERSDIVIENDEDAEMVHSDAAMSESGSNETMSTYETGDSDQQSDLPDEKPNTGISDSGDDDRRVNDTERKMS